MIAAPEAGLRATPSGPVARAADADPLAETLKGGRGSLQPLFGASEDRLRFASATVEPVGDVTPPDLSIFYHVDAPEDRLEGLANELREHEIVEAAYVKPPTEFAEAAVLGLNEMAAAEAEPPLQTPDFTTRQGYLDAAPGGIDARFAWTQAGGEGAGVRIVDVEGAWRFSHEDLTQNQGGVIAGPESTDIRWRNHGTAVIGEFGGDRNMFGVTGICQQANVRAISIFGQRIINGVPVPIGSSGAIQMAADALSAGDIILIELHRPGPRNNFAVRDDQRGYIAVEWWEDDFAAILYASSRGVIVVEAAGNGAEDLDDALYGNRPANFPPAWTNPFNRVNRDSGAVMVGAGAPPPGTHGTNVWGPDRSRLDFSNFGASIDAQGWGREVTTAGYGDLQGGANEDLWYTDIFSGTSSASPIVVGALGCLQGIVRARGEPALTPAGARQALRATGSAQQDAPGRPATQRIGNRPDLRALVAGVARRRITPAASWAASWAGDRLDVFGVGIDRALFHQWWDGQAWSPSMDTWERHDGVLRTEPRVIGWGQGRLDVFGLGRDLALYHQWWDGQAWGPTIDSWERHDGVLVAPPAIASWAPNRLDVFGVGSDRAMYHQWWDGQAWGPSLNTWERHDGVLVQPVTAVTWGPNRLDVLGVGLDGAMYHQWWDGQAWGPSLNTWERHDGVLIQPPTAVAWGPDRLDVFGVGLDGAMYHQWWDGQAWGPSLNTWERHDGVLISPVTAASWGPNRLDVFGVGLDGALYHQWWDGNAWGPSLNGWERHDGVLVEA